MAQDAAYYREYYKKTKARRRELAKKRYDEDEGIRESQKARSRAWGAENKERVSKNAKAAKDRGYKYVLSSEQVEAAREATRKWRKEHPDVVAEYSAYRQSLIKAQRNGPVSKKVAWTRSGGVCGWCGLPIDKDLKYPDPMSLSYDHKVPLSKGGLHTQDNIQCVHRICNIKKSNISDDLKRTKRPTKKRS